MCIFVHIYTNVAMYLWLPRRPNKEMILGIIIIVVIIMAVFLVEFFTPNLVMHRVLNPSLYNSITFKTLGVETDKGEAKCLASKIVFTGLCRDCGEYIDKNLRILEEAGKHFSDYKIVIFENDSKDGTRDMIVAAAKNNPRIILLDCEHMGSKDCRLNEINLYDYGACSLKRMKKMALFRNQPLTYVKEHLSDYEYLLTIDLDMEGTFSFDGLFNSIAYDGWDAIIPNARCPFPGTLGMVTGALDMLAFSPVDDTNIHGQKLGVIEATKGLLKMNYLMINAKDLVKVQSAFSGVALYKIPSILKCSYAGNTKCEHLDLHLDMKNHGCGNIYINPKWIIYFGIPGPMGNIKSLLDVFV